MPAAEVSPTRGPQAVTRLIPLVESGFQNSHPLTVSLSAAVAALGRDEAIPAVNELRAFQNKVQAQVAPSASALAEVLLGQAQEIIDVLTRDCGSPFKPKPKIGKVSRDTSGNMRMKFTAEFGWVYIIEASTNLVDWERIGVATLSDGSGFEFVDTQAMRFPSRYYRLIIP